MSDKTIAMSGRGIARRERVDGNLEVAAVLDELANGLEASHTHSIELEQENVRLTTENVWFRDCARHSDRIAELEQLLASHEAARLIYVSCLGIPSDGNITAAIQALQSELLELNALFNLQYTRMGEATTLWQQETGRDDTWPDLGDLLTWLMERGKAQR